MNQTAGIVLALAYIWGLLSTAVAWGPYAVAVSGLVLAIATAFWQHQQRRPRRSPGSQSTTSKPPSPPTPAVQSRIWLAAGVIGFLASLYLNVRTPHPTENDISQLIPENSTTQDLLITVRGEVTSSPRVTRSGRVQFWMDAKGINEITGDDSPIEVSQEVSGKLYVTAPLLQGTGLYPGLTIAATGTLYKPQPPSNPGGFDFKAYLAQQGTFAGFRGRYLSFQPPESPPWGLWQIRQRIVRSQVQGLGVPQGSLLSAMVLGRQAVDLPYDVRDGFVQVGLAHILAASGFHVSLLLGVVLGLTKWFSPRVRFGAGMVMLVVYVGLTGVSASVMRAALMGLAALTALLLNRQVKSLAVLTLAGVILLWVNPLWIWDLGFQFSFLATLGLLVTAPALMGQLSGLPPAIASLIAIPIAASVWTLPLQLYVFKIASPYSVVVNLITSPFVSVITLGGVFSGFVGLMVPELGSAIASVLHYPIQGLMGIVDFFNQQPGNSFAVGRLSLIQLITLYGLILGIWILGSVRESRQRGTRANPAHLRWGQRMIKPVPIAVMVAVLIIALPLWRIQHSPLQATVLATPGEPILLIREQGRVTLVNSGSRNTARYLVVPFLQHQGINQVNGAIATHSQLGLSSGWPTIIDQIPIRHFYDNPSPKKTYEATNQLIIDVLQSQAGVYHPLSVGQPVELGSVQLELLNADVPVVKLQMGDQTWMLLGEASLAQQLLLTNTEILKPTEVLWWSGEPLVVEILDLLKPKFAIASSKNVDPDTEEKLRQLNTLLFWTGRDGALHWTPTAGFETTLESDETDRSFF